MRRICDAAAFIHMPPPADHDPRADVKDLLLADYRNFAESLWKNEQTGETRVNWFIGIVTAAAGGLIGLTSAEHRPHGEPLRLIYVAVLFALLCFGVITLFRIFRRNAATDGYKKDSDRIRRMFRDHFDESGLLRNYNPFRSDKTDKKGLRKLGGLAHTVSVINSLVAAGIAAAFVYPFGWPSNLAAGRQSRIVWTYVIAALTFSVAAVGQYIWIRWTDAKVKESLRETTHAGGIVFCGSGNEVKYLLVGPSKEEQQAAGREEWLLPKGHIEPEEELWETALREVREETGVIGHPICSVGFDTFKVKGKKVKVKFYLLKSIAEVPCKETRRKHCFSFEDALKKLTYPGNIQLLHAAERKRRKFAKETRFG